MEETCKILQNIIKSEQTVDSIPGTITNLEGEIHPAQGDEAVTEPHNVFFTEAGTNLRQNMPLSSFDPLQHMPNVSEDM